MDTEQPIARSGRKRLYPGDHTKVSTYIPTECRDRLDRMARERNMTVSRLINRFVVFSMDRLPKR